MKEITIAAVFAREILQGAQHQGIDCQPILFKHGISELSLQDDKTRVPLEAFAAVAIDLMRVLDDEFLGLGERPVPLGSFAMMCRASISAKTLKRAIKRCAHYWNLFANTYTHKVIISGGRVFYEVQLRDGQQPLNNYATESLLASIHRYHCWLGGQFIPLISVSMDFPEPRYSDEYRPLFYGAPVKFNQACAQLEFDSSFLNQDIVQTPESLDGYIAGTNLSLLYQPKRYRTISDQVRQWLERNIRQGNYRATLKQASASLQMSQQVLHRRLQDEDTSFKEIKMQTRRDIAINLLFSKKYRIEEIAYRVGFSEPSAFIRAFKSWTGSTPLAYRQAGH